MRINQAGGDQAATTIIVIGDSFQQLVRLGAMRAAPHDSFAVADHRGILDHTDRRACKQATDVAQTSQSVSTVRPPITTFATSPAEQP